MSANLKKMHEDVDTFSGGYSQGYLSTWCSYVHEVSYAQIWFKYVKQFKEKLTTSII